MILEGIGMWLVISGSKLLAVPPIKFNADLMECVVMAATDNQEWQEAYNTERTAILVQTLSTCMGPFITKDSCGSQQKMTCTK
jgi:hypothetical protein